MNLTRAILLLCMMLAQPFLPERVVAATFRGKALWTNYYEGRPPHACDVSFKIVTDGCDYAMELSHALPGRNLRPVHTTYWTRTNGILYHSVIQPGDARCQGEILDESMPEPGHDPAPVLWTVYAWDCLARTNPAPASLRPVWSTGNPDSWNGGFSLPAEFAYSPRFPGRPEKIAFINDGRNRRIERDGTKVEYFDPPPFDHGYVNATIELHLANFAAGVSAPQSAAYRRYAPSASTAAGAGMTASLRLVESLDIITLEASLHTGTITLPKLLPGAVLHDSRQHKDLPFFTPQYASAPDGRWSLPEPAFIEWAKSEYLRVHPEFIPAGPIWKTVRSILVMAFLMATSITGGLLVRWTAARRTGWGR